MENNKGSKILLIPRLLLVLLAIADSIYLLIIENGLASCSVLGKTTCLTILPVYSKHLFIPLPILGLFGFSLLLFFTFLGYRNVKYAMFRRITAMFALIFSFYLLSYMIFIVHNICPFCLISFLLVSAYAFMEFVELNRKIIYKLVAAVSLSIIVVVLGVYFVSLSYQPREIFKEKTENFLANQKVLNLDYKKDYEESDKPLLIYIFSHKCDFCQYFVSEVLSDPEIQTRLQNYSFYVLDNELYNPFLKMISTKVTSVPSIVVWRKDGKQKYLSGLKKKEFLLEFLQD